MNTAVAVVPESAALVAFTAAQVKAHVQRVQEVMRSVMKKDVHYGAIPGTGDRMSLLKPGAEVLCMTFHIAPEYRIEDLSTDDCIRYRVTCTGKHQGSGVVISEGMGEASTGEEKYKWRKATKREFQATAEDRRRVKFGWDRQTRQEYELQQVRTEPADLANTVLKMACKRAQVAMTINATAASDIFTQDLEDLPEGIADGGEPQPEKPTTAAPQRAAGSSATAQLATAKQVELIRKRMDAAGIPETDFLKRYELQDFAYLPFAKVDDALAWIAQLARG